MHTVFNVLLVDDDPILGTVTVDGLRLLGHVVTWVMTAATALEALKKAHNFEVVLLDLRLGAESGDSIFVTLQLLKITYPPVIVLSAEPDAVLRLAAERIRTKHMLAKPASVQQIDAALRRAVTT